MPGGAPRRPARPWRALARGGWLAAGLWLAGPAQAQEIAEARYIWPTDRYAHGILGDAIEYAGLQVTLRDGRRLQTGFAEGGRVFEDIAPRLWDITGDGAPEIVVIETDPPQGAQLAVYAVRDGSLAKIAATPHIGRTNRWLAPVGAADLDGDGAIEIAFVDRPHLAKILRVWRYADGALTEVAAREGLTNHRIGEDFITGGLRDCGAGPELITADAGWRLVVATRLGSGGLVSRPLGPFGRAEVEAALACR